MEGFRATARSQLQLVEVYEEYLDVERFPALLKADHARYIRDKYARTPPDVIVAIGTPALRFSLDRLRGMMPGIPIVFGMSHASFVKNLQLPPNVTGRTISMTLGASVAMARRLQPDADSVVVIAGTSAIDSSAMADALASAGPQRDSIRIVPWQGLPYDSLLARLHRLSPQTIVFFAHFRQDGRGQAMVPLEIVPEMARASGAPMYGFVDLLIGSGIVGGAVWNHSAEARATALLTTQVLRRSPTQPLPAVEPAHLSFMADARALRRWGMDPTRVPPQTEVLFRTPTAWERYRWVILAAVGVMILQSILIGLLMAERRQRERAARQAEKAERQVAHIGRIAMMGELAATIAHELRQPLAAIRINAELGKHMLDRGALPIDQAKQLCNDIVADSVRAADVIDHIRSLLRKERQQATETNLNSICQEAAELLKGDARRRSVRLELSLDPNLPLVLGYPIELQQVVINLVLNALDAAATSSGERRVAVETSAPDSHVELLVRDNGPGLSAENKEQAFESFFTTKEHGTGVGLVIVRSIVERHRGHVQVENGKQGGAVFRVRLPALEDLGNIEPPVDHDAAASGRVAVMD